MKKVIRDNKWLLAVIFVALLIRMMYFLYAKPWEDSLITEKFKGDANEYRMLAEKTIEDGKYPENFVWDTFRTPVFPLFIVFFYLIFGIKPYIIFIVNILLNLVSIFYIYFICKEIFNLKIIFLITAALFALEPNFIKSITEYLPDTLYSTLFVISVYYFIVSIRKRKYFLFILSSILFGIATLTRPINSYFYLLCILFIVIYPHNKLFYKLKLAVLFVLFYFITISPWMYRNYKVYNYFSTNAYQGNAALYYAGITKSAVENKYLLEAFIEFDNTLKNICEKNNITNPFEIDKQKQSLGFEYILNHLDVYIPLHINGMLKFFIAPANNNNYSALSRVLLILYFTLIYSLVLVGVYGMFKNKQYLYSISLIVVVFYFSFLTGVVGIARYRLPSTAFYLILCAFGINFILSRFKKN